MRILIYGAGVIGSLYARVLSAAGNDVTVYARGKRLAAMQEKGLQYKENGAVHTAKVQVLRQLIENDVYDFVFLTVKGNQLVQALQELRDNCSPTIVTMANTVEPYAALEQHCGAGRILPAFPGAGGRFDGDVLEATLTPRAMQVTTFGEIDGCHTARLQNLVALCQGAGIPYAVEKDMHAWQLCHLALVVPFADAYYAAKNPERAGEEKDVMVDTTRRIQQNLKALNKRGVTITPPKMKGLMRLPPTFARMIVQGMFRGEMGRLFMYPHAMKATDEMHSLHDQFYQYLAGGK